MTWQQYLTTCLCLWLAWSCARSEAVPLPDPDLQELGPAAADVVRQARNSTQTALAEAREAEQRGAAFGEFGMLLQAYQFRNEALACFESATQLDPVDFRWWYLLGRLYQNMGRQDEGAEALRESLQRQPEYVPAMVALGEYYRKRNQLDHATSQFEAAVAEKPSCVTALAGLAQIQLTRGQPAKALTLLNEALRHQPNASVLYYLRGRALQDLGRETDAAASFALRSQRLEPVMLADPIMEAVSAKRVSATTQLAEANRALSQGRLQAGFAILEELVAGDPRNFAFRVRLANAYLQMGRLDDALDQFQTAVSLNPAVANVHYNMGGIQSQRGDLEAALLAFRRARELQPNMWEAQLAEADTLRRLGRFAEAADIYAGLATASESVGLPRSDRAAAAIGRSLCRAVAGDSERALAAVRQDLRAFPNDPVLTHILVRLLVTVPASDESQGEQALNLLQSLQAQQSNATLRETEAMVLAAMGRFDVAVQIQVALIQQLLGQVSASYLQKLEDNLAKYKMDQPCREPWQADDPLLQLPSYRR